MRRTSALILYDDKKRVLLQHRDLDAPVESGKWGLFGGHIKEGETLETGVKREAREELEIDLKNIRLFKTYIQEDDRGRRERNVFIGPLKYPIEKLRQQQKEGDDLDLFALDELDNLKITEENLKLLKEIIKTL